MELVGGQAFGGRLDGDEIKGLFPFADHELALRHPAALHGHEIHLGLQRQAGQEAELAAVKLLRLVEKLREIVFEELLAVGGESGDDLLVLGLDGHETEVKLFARGGPDLRGDAGGGGLFLVGGVGFRIDEVEGDLAAGGARIFAEHLPHPLGVVLDSDRQGAGAAREVEVELDRLLDLAEERPGAGRQRVDFLRGGIEARGNR
jgi:hypothetical protein